MKTYLLAWGYTMCACLIMSLLFSPSASGSAWCQSWLRLECAVCSQTMSSILLQRLGLQRGCRTATTPVAMTRARAMLRPEIVAEQFTGEFAKQLWTLPCAGLDDSAHAFAADLPRPAEAVAAPCKLAAMGSHVAFKRKLECWNFRFEV